jgi:hypothetical protein
MNIMDDAKPQPTAAPPKSPRRWFRFSLRTMMVVVTLLCVWLGVVSNRANRQRRAVETITSHSGHVRYDYQRDDPFAGNPFADDPPPPGPDWMRNLIGIDYFATVVEVDINEDVANDDIVAALGDLPHLRSLALGGAGVTDSVLARARRMDQLHTLGVGWSAVSEAGWEPIEQLSNLKRLFLAGPNVSDSTLSHFKGLSELTILALNEVQVTDSGLKQLKSLVHLEQLRISGTKFTPAGIEDLKRSLPKLFVTGYERAP